MAPVAMSDGFLAELATGGLIDDPWLGGELRLDATPVVLSATVAAQVAEAACAVALMLDTAVPRAAAEPAWLGRLGLDPTLAAIACLDAPRWLGLARADVFLCGNGPAQVCELNCDTPTGLAECCELARIATARYPHLADPSAALPQRWLAMVRMALPSGLDQPVVGIVDPTDLPEDLAHVRLLTRWLESAGCRVVRGSPFNLHACPGRRVGLFGSPCDVLVRHYKTDWWAQRRSAWRDEPPPPCAGMLGREIALIADAMDAGTVTVLNPWGAAIAQSKRALALPWEQSEWFPPAILEAVRRHLPETRWLDTMSHDRLLAERGEWVLKSAFGCEGEEVIMGIDTDAARWHETLRRADPTQWIAQRAFTPRRDADGHLANHGVYLIGGAPSGIYTRCSVGPTDRRAYSRPTLLHLGGLL
jgi:glutathionylspermidine synthase